MCCGCESLGNDVIEALMASNPTRSSLTYQAMGASCIDLCSKATSVWDANIQPETKGDCNIIIIIIIIINIIIIMNGLIDYTLIYGGYVCLTGVIN